MLKAARKECGVSQAELARRAGIARTTLAHGDSGAW